MNILRPLKSLGAWCGMRWKSFSLESRDWMPLFGDYGNSKISVEQSKRCTTVFSCTRLLSDTIAQLPLKLNKTEGNGNSIPAKQDPLYSVLAHSPNAWQTAFDYWKWNMECLLYRGWFISVKLKSTNGKIVGLLPLHPDTVKVKQQKDGSLKFSGDGIIGPSRTVNLDNLKEGDVFYCMYATTNGVTPISPIAYNSEAIGLSISATNHGKSFLENDATPPLVIEYPNRVDEESLKMLAKQWVKKGSGRNAGTPKVVEHGAKVTKLAISNQDAQYLELRQFQKEDICGIFGVPPHMIGDTKQAKGWSTVEMQGIDFVTYTINPWTIRIEQAIRRDLIPRGEWSRKESKFMTQALMRGDAKARVLYYKELRLMGALSANEIRRLEDMNIIDSPEADEYWRPANILIDNGNLEETNNGKEQEIQ